MLTPSDIQNLAIAKSKGKRPQYLDERSNDDLLSMILVLAEELAVTRERADTLERLLEQHGLIERSQIEAYIPDEAEAVERQISNSEFTARLLRSLRHKIDAMSGGNKSTEEMVDFLKKN